MAETDDVNPSEFILLRRLLANEQPETDEPELRSLMGKRFIRMSESGWVVTVQGHAAFLHELRKSFDRPAARD